MIQALFKNLGVAAVPGFVALCDFLIRVLVVRGHPFGRWIVLRLSWERGPGNILRASGVLAVREPEFSLGILKIGDPCYYLCRSMSHFPKCVTN